MEKCKECGKQFEPIRYNHIYCSLYCRGRANYRRRHPENFEPRICTICNKSFILESSGKKNYVCPDCQPIHDKLVQHESYIRHKHPCVSCGKSCSSHAILCKPCRIKQNRGRNSYAFRGNPIKTRQGYIFISVPEHPFRPSNGKVAQHRLIMEKAIGRYLASDEIVHHLNGIRHDNRLGNLVITKCHSHSSWTFIKALQKRIRDLEVRLSQQKF